MTDFEFLTFEEVERLHAATLARHGGGAGILDRGAIESALNAPQADAYYLEADVFAVGAAYLFHIAQAHGFVDGNKRTALAAMGLFLFSHGVSVKPNGADLEALTIGVASGELSKEQTVERVEQLFGLASFFSKR